MHRHLIYTIAGTIALSVAACGDDEATVVLPDLQITTEELPGGAEGVDYRVSVVAEGGNGDDFRWSIADGGLPAGVFLRSEGTPESEIAGLPRSGGTSTFTIRVRDSAGNEATADLSIEIAAAPPAVQIVTESIDNPLIPSTYTATITAMNGTGYSWRISSGQVPPGLTLAESGTPSTTLSGMPSEDGRYSFTVLVISAEGNRSTQQYTVDVVDTRPELQIVTQQLPEARVNAPYEVELVGLGGSGMDYRWTVQSGELPPGLSLEEEGTPTAKLSGTPTIRGSYAFRIEVEDSAGDTARQSFFIEVAPPRPPLRIVTFELPPGRAAEAYSAPVRAVNGSSEGYMFEVVDGALPAGLSIRDDQPEGIIEGVPTQDGTFSFRIRVTDSEAGTAEQDFTLRIAEEIIPVAIDRSGVTNGVIVLPNAQGGVPYSATIGAQDGAPLPANSNEADVRYNWVVTAGELPPGLRVNPNGQGPDDVGTFEGLAEMVGTYTATVTVFDRLNNTDSVRVEITVEAPTVPIQIVTSTIAPLASSGCFSVDLTAAGGGNTGYTWSVTSGALPGGYDLEQSGTPSTRIVGTPTVQSGTFPVTIQVQDTFGDTASQDFNLVVDPNKQGLPRWGVVVGDGNLRFDYELYVSDLCSGEQPSDITRLTRAPSGSGVQRGIVSTIPSPAGNAVAFIADIERSSFNDVYVVDLRDSPTTGSVRRVLQSSSTFLEPFQVRWSPDGSKLGIIYDATQSSADELWVADVSDLANPQQAVRVSQQSTTSSRELYGWPSSFSGPFQFAFSPDGTKVVYNGDFGTAGRQEAWVVDLTGMNPSAPEKIHADFTSTSMDVNPGFLWTPDSRGVVFNADLNTVSRDELFFTDVSGTAPYTAVSISGMIQSSGDVSWYGYPDENLTHNFSPDGTQLFFMGDLTNDGEDDLYILDYANGAFNNRKNVTALTTSGAEVRFAKWSPDGSRILAEGDLRTNSQFEHYVLPIAGQSFPVTVAAIRAGNGSLGALATTTLARENFKWSPDGTKVAFIGDYSRSGSNEIFYADVSGNAPYTSFKLNEDTRNSAEDVIDFQFSPDGQKIAFAGDVRSSFDEIFFVDVSGPTPTSAQTIHPQLTSTAFDAWSNGAPTGFPSSSYNYGPYYSWGWINNTSLVFRGDLTASGQDRAWYVDVGSGTPTEPLDITGSSQFTTTGAVSFLFMVNRPNF